MELQELIKRSKATKRHNARVNVDLYTICFKVKHSPGLTAYAHYGNSLMKSKYYDAFDRARHHGLINNKFIPYGIYGGKTLYYLTELGQEFLDKYND